MARWMARLFAKKNAWIYVSAKLARPWSRIALHFEYRVEIDHSCMAKGDCEFLILRRCALPRTDVNVVPL
jgi:hypothetical protein